jgi:hypothetical protein
MANPIKAIMVRGDFTADEFAQVVAVLRRIDTARPTARLQVTAIDVGGTTILEAEAILRQALPDQEDRTTDWLSFSAPLPRRWAD